MRRNKFFTTAAALTATAAISATAVATAASSPTVSTGGADGITQNSAVLHGTVTPNGSSTTYYFEWGLTNGYGDQHSASSAGSGTTTKSVGQSAGHLIPGTVYHYRLVATNQSGTSVGADRTFETAGAPPPGVSTGPATLINIRGADVTGTISPSGQKTTWYFEWGTTTSYAYQTTAHTASGSSSSVNVIASLQNVLAPGTIYHYRLVATHVGSPPSYGADATFMTYTSPRPVPAVSASTQPRRPRHRPYVFTTSGHVTGPSWIPAQYACQGDVTIRFFRGLRQVGFTLAAVQPTCGFSAQTRFGGFRHRAGQRVHLRVVIRYIHTGYLATNRAGYEHLTLG